MDTQDKQIENALKRQFERTLPERIKRTTQLQYKKVIGGHYFAYASSECLMLYRDGFFLGTIMATQAVIEALIRFVAERSKRNRTGDLEEKVKELYEAKILSETAKIAALNVWRYRNDFHHLNPSVTNVDTETRAKECIDGLFLLEDEIFGGFFNQGKFIPNQPVFYDIDSSENTAPVFLRQLDV